MVANEQIRKAAELCEEGGFSSEELAVYEAYWDWVRTEKTIREGSLARGEAIGRTAEKENVVINSHKAGLPVETISSIIGLTTEQIIEILKRHGLM